MGLLKRKKATPNSAPPTKKAKTEENGESESWSFPTLVMGGKGRKGRGDELIGGEGKWDDEKRGKWLGEPCIQVGEYDIICQPS